MNALSRARSAVRSFAALYLTIPPERSGKGKINILIQERYAEYEAVTDNKEPAAVNALSRARSAVRSFADFTVYDHDFIGRTFFVPCCDCRYDR